MVECWLILPSYLRQTKIWGYKDGFIVCMIIFVFKKGEDIPSWIYFLFKVVYKNFVIAGQ